LLRLIVFFNEKLLEVMGDDLTQEQAFAQANDVLKNAVGGISDIIHIPGLVNVDIEDVRTVLSEPGKAMMGTAVACPLREGIDLSGARRHAGSCAGADRGEQEHLQADREPVTHKDGDEHHPPLRGR
jgi:cell division GTPase FtsZ